MKFQSTMLLPNLLMRTALLGTLMSVLVATRPASAEIKGSGDNYLLYNGCRSVDGLTVSLHVTQDMVANVSPGNTANGGFAMQLNANPPAGLPVWWMQYGIIIQNSQASGFIQYWDNAGVNNHNQPVFMNLPSNTISAGWVLSIHLTNDSNGNVNSATFIITDNAGVVYMLPMPMPTYPNTNTPVLVPIQSFQLDIVGPINWEGSTFSSGEGYTTYQVSNGQLSVPSESCPNGQFTGTGETSNTTYGLMNPSSGATVTQPFATPYAGALASSNDTAHDRVEVFNLGVDANSDDNLNVHQYAFNGTWSYADVGANVGVVPASLGSPIISYVNTIYSDTEAFYLTSDARGNQDIEQLWGASWSPNNLTSDAAAQPAALGSGLVGYIDTIANSDNVFYQGQDQHVHLLTWTPVTAWAEDTRLNAPVAAFASALHGHMTEASDEVFYIGTNQHIYELWRWSKNYDGWHSVDVTLANGSKPVAAIGSPLAGFYDPAAGTDAVFYVGTNRHVYELLFSPSSVWSSIDVTSKVGAPNTGAGTALAAHLNTAAKSEEVFFVTSTGALEELWSWSTAVPAWNTSVLPVAIAPEAGSPLTTNMDSATNPVRDEVYYIGTDDVIHEMWGSSNSGGWQSATP
jgi:hypothetical protein